MSGRRPTILKGHNYLDCRIVHDSLTKFNIKQIVDEMIALEIIDISENYAYGQDHENDVVTKTHYHIRGKTKFLTSRMKKLRSDSEILSSVPSGQAHMMLASKMIDDTKGDYLSYLGYVGKDKLLYSSCELDLKTAKEKYSIKLKRLKEKKIVHNEKETLQEYLTEKVKAKGRTTLSMGVQDYKQIQAWIVEYALDNDKRYILSRTNLMSYTVLYLGQTCLTPPDLLVELIDGNII